MIQWFLQGKLNTLGDIGNKLIDPLPFRVGRRPDASLTLPRATVSGMHAEFFGAGDKLFVRDLGSTNGTFINGQRLQDVQEVKADDVVQFADLALRVVVATPKSDSHTMSEDFCDHALARVQFAKLLRDEVVTPYFQPIVDLASGDIQAFEVLARSKMIGLETPGRMFAAAFDLQKEAELSDLMRRKGIEVCRQFEQAPVIYLNTHPSEFTPNASTDWVSDLRDQAPYQRLVIEIHEAAITDVIGIARFRAMLKDFDMGLAFDDFGAGQARLAELSAVRPDCVKFDRSMICAIDSAEASRQRFVRSLVSAVRDIGVTPLAEGIETVDERDACIDLGFELAQGYLLGMPRPFENYSQWHVNTSASPAEAVACPAYA